jgi:hypothetical protein
MDGDLILFYYLKNSFLMQHQWSFSSTGGDPNELGDINERVR